MTTTIWHNPRCSKSRQTLALLEEHGIQPEVVRYLDDPPTEARLHEVLGLLKITATELVRNKEKLFKELGLKGATNAALVTAMAKHPKLIERPIVIHGGRAALGRPPEQVLELFS